MPMAGFCGGMTRKILPTQRRVSFWSTDKDFYEQQDSQRVARDVHGPSGPLLGCAKRPRTENQHGEYEHPAQIIADAIELDVRCPQREKRAGHRIDPGAPGCSRGLRNARRLIGVSHTPDW